ncbi:hypothetical protein BaRGS_00034216, partial [Batillaria attramentaria]
MFPVQKPSDIEKQADDRRRPPDSTFHLRLPSWEKGARNKIQSSVPSLLLDGEWQGDRRTRLSPPFREQPRRGLLASLLSELLVVAKKRRGERVGDEDKGVADPADAAGGNGQRWKSVPSFLPLPELELLSSFSRPMHRTGCEGN